MKENASFSYRSYREYLNRPEFKIVRFKVMKRANWRCEICGKRATEVHHLKYPRWGAFDVPENLIAICHECHCKIHGKED